MKAFNLRYVKPSAFIIMCGILFIALLTANEYISTHWGVSFSVFAFIGSLFAIVNSYLWNIKPFSWMYSIPDFSGRYEGTLTYSFRDGDCELISDTLTHIKVITQNGSDIVINSWTRKKYGTLSTKSTSLEASIVEEKDGTFSIVYNYLNEGNSDWGFSPHYGTEILKILENGEGKHLVGRYYTERLPFQTKGKLDMKYTGKSLYHEK